MQINFLLNESFNTLFFSNTWCRGPGTLEGIAMIENIVEHIAFSLGKEPLEIRMENLLHGSEMNKILPEFVKSVGMN